MNHTPFCKLRKMKTFPRRSCRPLLGSIAALLFCSAAPLLAQTWTGATSSDWNTATNWNPNTVPNSSSAVAVFGTSATTTVTASNDVTVGSIVFNAGASAYTISPYYDEYSTTIAAPASSTTPAPLRTLSWDRLPTRITTISTSKNSASAGSNTVYTNYGGTLDGYGGYIEFDNNSTAGNAVFINTSATNSSSYGGEITFYNSSTAGNATITNNASTVSGAYSSGGTFFFDSSTAGNALITNNGQNGERRQPWFHGFLRPTRPRAMPSSPTTARISVGGLTYAGFTQFYDNSTAGNATLIANGGSNGGRGRRHLLQR